MTADGSVATLPDAYFDTLYARDPDPWRFRTSDYEREKYGDTAAALARTRYVQALEVGCSIGELSAVLARRCDALLGIDVAEAAITAARRRNTGAPHARFERRRFPQDAPSGAFDLIVLSEVLYYFSADDLPRVACAVETALAPAGEVLLCHWLGETPDYPLGGDAAVEAFLRAAGPWATTTLQHRRPLYRLDRLVRADG